MVGKNQSNEPPVRQLIRFSNYSLCITLPKEYVDTLHWKQGDRIAFQLNPANHSMLMQKSGNSKNPAPLPSEISSQALPATTNVAPPNIPSMPQPDKTPAELPSQPDSSISYQDLEPIPPIN